MIIRLMPIFVQKLEDQNQVFSIIQLFKFLEIQKFLTLNILLVFSNEVFGYWCKKLLDFNFCSKFWELGKLLWIYLKSKFMGLNLLSLLNCFYFFLKNKNFYQSFFKLQKSPDFQMFPKYFHLKMFINFYSLMSLW